MDKSREQVHENWDICDSDIKEYYDFRNGKEQIKIQYADEYNLDSWMSLVHIVKWNFPGLETEEKLEEYKHTVIEFMNRKTAVCAVYGNMVVGILLFSKKYNQLCCMAVHPDFRRKKIASDMVGVMLQDLDCTKDIIVDTFREEDEKGAAPRAFYKSMGFEEGELRNYENGYPEQRFILKGRCENE